MEFNGCIGIDFGNSYCKVGINSTKVDIIPNEQGTRSTPSIVSFTEEDKLFGIVAKNQLVRNFENTFFNLIKDKETKEEYISMVLLKLKKFSEDFLNGKKVNKLLISGLPFNYPKEKFEKIQKEIGIEMEIIETVYSICISYGLDLPEISTKGLIIDFGGTFLNLTLMNIEKGYLKVIKHESFEIGGKDFDQILINHFINEFKQKNKIDISKEQKALNKLKLECENIKITLSVLQKANIEIDSLFEGIDLFSSITRARFEMLSNSLIFKLISFIDSFLKDVDFQFEKILLSGGTCYIPKVQLELQNYFKKDLTKLTYLEESTIIGTSIQASLIKNNLLFESPSNFYLKKNDNSKLLIIEKFQILPFFLELSLENEFIEIYQEDDLILKSKENDLKLFIIFNELGLKINNKLIGF